MVKHSPHKRWKGCPMCSVYRDDGVAKRSPVAVLRMLGRDRRISRHEIPEGD